MFDSATRAIKSITEIGIALLALAIIATLLVGEANMAFLGDVVGNIIKCKLYKSRLTKENSMVDVMLNYDSGLNPYHGLVDLGIECGVLKKVSNRVEFPDGRKAYEKSVYNEPEKYFTDEVMWSIEQGVGKIFKYGSSVSENKVEDEHRTTNPVEPDQQ